MDVNSTKPKAPPVKRERRGDGLVAGSIRAMKNSNVREAPPPDSRAQKHEQDIENRNNMKRMQAAATARKPVAERSPVPALSPTGLSRIQDSLMRAADSLCNDIATGTEHKVAQGVVPVAAVPRASNSTSSNRDSRDPKVRTGRASKTGARTEWNVPTAREKLEKLKRNLESLKAEETDCLEAIMVLVAAIKDEASIKAEGLDPQWNDGVQEQIARVHSDLAAVRLKITAAQAQLEQAQPA